MNSYKRLEKYLYIQKSASVTLTFDQVEDILGFKLPAEAIWQSGWWSNAVSDGGSQAIAWLKTFRRVSYVEPGRGVTFIRCRLVDSNFQTLRL